MDRPDNHSLLEEAQEKRRARWKRNKRAERKRKRPPMSAKLSADSISEVWQERERRAEAHPGWITFNAKWRGGRGSWEFQCDSWAVRTLLQLEFWPRKVTAGKVARWMWSNDLQHGYNQASLRTMVYRAFEAIDILESVTNKAGDPFWPPFVPTGGRQSVAR